jgi:CBS-domain-containing membrane protein
MATRETPTALPLRFRTTFDGDGDVCVEQSVPCPARGVSVTVDDCMACGHCARPPGEGERTLECLHPAARRNATTRPLRPVRLPSDSELTPLSQVMTTAVVCVRQELLVQSLATLLLGKNISAAPVVDAAGRPVGVVTKTDLVRWFHEDAGFADASGPDREAEELGLSARAVRPTTVADVMTPLAFTLQEEAPIAYAAALMTVESVHHLPIVAGSGEVVGIVSALDLVRWMAKRDGFVVSPERS